MQEPQSPFKDNFKSSTPVVRETYETLVKQLHQFGDVIEEPKKTSIHLKNKSGFAGVHPRKEYINLEFVSQEPVKNMRVLKSEQVSKSRYHNLVKLENPEDIDSQLLEWLKDAYHLMG